MRERDTERAEELESALLAFHEDVRPLPGIVPVENRLPLIEQFLESIRRVKYVHVIRDKVHSPRRADPRSDLFDPLKAAAIQRSMGNMDEACWLVFLATHFGKHRTIGWRLVRDVYGALGGAEKWSWDRVAANPEAFGDWLRVSYAILTGDGTPRHFGNHRKYETLRPDSAKGTSAVVASYARWVLEHENHQQLFADALTNANEDRQLAFRYLYNNMQVLRFGRTAKFDYLTMLGKLDLAPIDADSAYLVNATGPLRGARLLFGGSVLSTQLGAQELDVWLVELAEALSVGMQEMEDALCNWQKTPARFVRFRG